MAKKALLDVLEQTIGKYVKNLDAESLNVAVWSGKIELNNLELDVNAVNHELDRQAADSPNLAVPLRVMGGSFENFQVEVPWAHLMSRPVVLRARCLSVSVEPYDRLSRADYLQAVVESERERIEHTQEARRQSIRIENEIRLRKNAVTKLTNQNDLEDGSKQPTAGSESTFSSRLVRRIMENIQVEISDVHVSLKGAESTAGVVLGSLSLVTTDVNGNRTFVDRSSGPQDLSNSFLYKSLQIAGLGIYMDENDGKYNNYNKQQIQGTKLKSIGEENDEKIKPISCMQEHSYILSPLSFEANLRKADSTICIDYPKYKLNSELSALSILLSKTQLEYFRDINRALKSGNGARPLFPEYRPLCRVTKQTAGIWWRYAARCVGRINGRRSWVEFFSAFQARKKYIPLYKRKAHHESCSWLKELNEEEVAELENIEQDRTISMEGIMAWRNIADGQFEKEEHKRNQQKQKKQSPEKPSTSSSLYFSLFGSKKAAEPSTDTEQDDSDDEPPITLTLEEMKELEDLNMIQAKDSNVSDDSKLYDAEFVLGSFKINLTSHDMQQLVLFEMGKVATTFNASADGAFFFDLKLFSLQIEDKVTPNSLFPAILSRAKTMHPFAGDGAADADDAVEEHVFHLNMDKTKAGDQKLTVKLTEFQAIASPLLLVELKRFYSNSRGPRSLPNGSPRKNPTLEQSLTGSVDLFYDAEEGDMPNNPLPDSTNTDSSATVADISNKLADAWKKKAEEKTSLVIDLDVHAPQLLIPENCIYPDANLLLFDLGHFKFCYGKTHVPKIHSWFGENPRPQTNVANMPSLECGKLEINNLTFMVDKAGTWSKLTAFERRASIGQMGKTAAVIEPISIALDFGVESSSQKNSSASTKAGDNDASAPSSRVCAIGMIPSIAVSASPTQGSRVYIVFMAWSRLLNDLNPSPVAVPPPISTGEPQVPAASQQRYISPGMDLLSPKSIKKLQMRPLADVAVNLSAPEKALSNAFTVFHFSMGLQKLSVEVLTDIGSIDANLVSVDVALSNMSDGSSRSRLNMGWFWILDRLEYGDAPRRQRLFAHSSLPKSPQEFSVDDKYDILEELRKQGIFEEGSGSSELADITFTKIGSKGFAEATLLPEELASEDLVVNGVEKVDKMLCAKFSSLYIHLNPYAIRKMSEAYSKFMTILQVSAGYEGSGGDQITIVPAELPVSKPIGGSLSSSDNRANEGGETQGVDSKQGILLVQFHMRSFEVSLDSAKDDLPLFAMTMANASINVLMSHKIDEEKADMILSLALGDLRIKTSEMGRTLGSYRTMVGLAPGLSKSLLSVKYYSGPRAMHSSTLDRIHFLTERTASSVIVELSPMRMVYIHAQVMALVEYITEGILGSLAARAASSAAAAAAAASKAEMAVRIRATAFNVVYPQSACNLSHFSVQSGEVEVNYISLPGNEGAKVQLSLSGVLLQDSNHAPMQDDPIRLSIDVSLPPLEIGTVEDQAMRVSITISSASFKLSKSQYQQIMSSLDENIGELDLFLRNDDFGEEATQQKDLGEDTVNPPISNASEISHAGVVVVDIIRRMYVEVIISVLSLEIYNDPDPIARIAAVESKICFQKLPDQLKKSVQITLGNLECEDLRNESTERQYRSLINNYSFATEGKDDDKEKIFYVSYESHENGSSQIDLKIGSTCLVFFPDAISAILNFVKLDENRQPVEQGATLPSSDLDGVTSKVLDAGLDAIETSLSFADTTSSVATTSLTVATSRCAFIFVDLGHKSSNGKNSSTAFVSDSDTDAGMTQSMVQRTQPVTSQVIESVVFEGACSLELLYSSDKRSGEMKNTELQLFGEGMEIYSAFGRDRESPVQILEPAGFSIVLSTDVGDDKTKKIDVRAAALSPLDFSFSMKNVALISAIISGLHDCVKEEDVEENKEEIVPLNDEEALRIQNLAFALEHQDGMEDASSTVGTDHGMDISLNKQPSFSVQGSTETIYTTFSLNITLPESTMTFINDLQGLDEALFRITVQNFVTGCKIISGETKGSLTSDDLCPVPTLYNFHVNTLLLADYFDSSVNLWKILLTRPWEVTLKSARGKSPPKFGSRRLSTSLDIDSFPCHISFSEQFLVSLAAANRMWSIYTLAISSAVAEVEKRRLQGSHEDNLAEKSAAASVARNWITTLPYALDNQAGINAKFSCSGSREHYRECANGSIQYFRFDPPRGKGFGGKRVYGQDITRTKCLRIIIDDDPTAVIEINHVDAELGQPRRAFELGNGRMLMTYVAKEGKTTVVHLCSSIEIHNHTSIPFSIFLLEDSFRYGVGVCKVKNTKSSKAPIDQRSIAVGSGTLAKSSQSFGIPVDRLSSFVRSWKSRGKASISLSVSPQLSDSSMPAASAAQTIGLNGPIHLEPSRGVMEAVGGTHTFCCDVVCRPVESTDRVQHVYSFVLQTSIKMFLVDDKYLFISIYLEPRAEVINRMPVTLSVRTPMPHTFSSIAQENEGGNEIIHLLEPDCRMEIFTPGPSIAVAMKCSDMPVAGNSMGWMEGGWIDLPLVSEFRLLEPLPCLFPFNQKTTKGQSAASSLKGRGSEFVIAEGTNVLSDLGSLYSAYEKQLASQRGVSERKVSAKSASEDERFRWFYVTICNYAVDHTGDILFEELDPSNRNSKSTCAFSTFASTRHKRRITLLPLHCTAPVRLLQMSMDLDEGIRRSMPFCVEDVSICKGGVESTPITWENHTPSGYFAYRMLVSSYQSEIHIIPEFVVFNGSESFQLVVRQPGSADITIDPGKIAPVWVVSAEKGLILSMEYTAIQCRTAPMRVDSLGLKVAMVRSIAGGSPMGSLAIQTVLGALDSRIVVKVGEVKYGSLDDQVDAVPKQERSPNSIQDDFLRFRIQSSELRLTVNEAPSTADSIIPEHNVGKKQRDQELCTVIFRQFTIDWQKIFKEEKSGKPSERSQVSVLLNSFQILDNTPGTPYPIVFHAMSDTLQFVDFCARFRGSFDADLVKVDLFDLNLNHKSGHSERITLSTSEDFSWKIVDLFGRIGVASAELAGDSMIVKWDENHGGYIVTAGDASISQSDETKYEPPKGDKLYHITRARVSPFKLLLSFERNPQKNRYEKKTEGQGAELINYFSRHLKFKIDKAELKFPRYEKTHLKGPKERLFEELTAVYHSLIKKKLIVIMASASFHDWKYLASRDEGDDEFVDGDILRITGNLAGSGLGLVTRKFGKGLGKGVVTVTGRVGEGIESASDRIGAGVVGAGINSVVSGVGQGVGDTLSGVGIGAGKVLTGAGKGIGQVAGGVSGGVFLVGKGIGRGVVKGDARAVVSGVTGGATAIGQGIGKGVETAAVGAAEGVMSAGKGLFSGVKNVGKGIGGAFTGKRRDSYKG